jgi:hypothetical protein
VTNTAGIIHTDSKTADMVSRLPEETLTEVWRILSQSGSDLPTRLSHAQIQDERQQALDLFESKLDEDCPESWWQKYFEANPWIFGYGLSYQFLNSVEETPLMGGADVSGKGSRFLDSLRMTEGYSRFTVLVEIKKPDTDLLDSKYRKRVAHISKELTSGVSQLQVAASTWENQDSRSDENRDRFDKESTYTVQPKGILVIGHLKQLVDDRDKLKTFQLFRRNIANPEIITFDELYQRARHIVDNISTNS